MLTTLYVDKETPVHRARPVIKIAFLFCVCTGVFVWDSWLSLILVMAAMTWLYLLARISISFIYQSIQPVIWILSIIFVVQIYLTNVNLAAFVVLRFATLILAASLVTLTTRTSEMVEGIESALRFVPNQKIAEDISLAISLCLRFIPSVRHTFTEVREAQQARGLSNDWRALLTPTIVRTLKSADEISQAIIARSPTDSGYSRNSAEGDRQ